jgi:hypothetical protein
MLNLYVDSSKNNKSIIKKFKAANGSFDNEANFKYLGMTITGQNFIKKI